MPIQIVILNNEGIKVINNKAGLNLNERYLIVLLLSFL
jgi:hypothetical protein